MGEGNDAVRSRLALCVSVCEGVRDADWGCCSLCLHVSSSTLPLNKLSLNVNALFSSYFLPKVFIDTLMIYHVFHYILTLVYSLLGVHDQKFS